MSHCTITNEVSDSRVGLLMPSSLLKCLFPLDWGKAYDRVMHNAFLDRLAPKGVTGKISSMQIRDGEKLLAYTRTEQ
jgi:hypothetical protein